MDNIGQRAPPAHDPPSGVPVEALAIDVEEDRAFKPFTDSVEQVERTLIWTHRESLLYKRVGKRFAPTVLTPVVHRGDPPAFVT